MNIFRYVNIKWKSSKITNKLSFHKTVQEEWRELKGDKIKLANIFKESADNIKNKENQNFHRKPFFTNQISKKNENLVSAPVDDVIIEDGENSPNQEIIGNIEVVHATLSSIRTKPEFQEYKKKYKFYCRHLGRQHNVIYFVACTQSNCQHCQTIKTDTRGVRYLQKMGGKLFQPTPSEENPGHYLTFIESDTTFRNNPQDIPPIDSQQPSMKEFRA